MNLPFKRVISLFAAPALAGLLAFTVNADELKEIRIAVPDLSAGTQHSGGGVVDVLRDQQIFEKAFADQDRKSTRLNSSHIQKSRMPSSA